jgi:amino acid adenylation domain-containing protein
LATESVVEKSVVGNVLRPLTLFEEGLWLARVDAGPAYHGAQVFRVQGELDIEALRAAWADVCRVEADLRKAYSEVEPVVGTHGAGHETFRHVDASGLSEAEVRRLVEEDFKRPFALSETYPSRLSVFRVGPSEHIVLEANHHISTDAHSGKLIYEHLSAAYAARIAKRAFAPQVGVPYALFAQEHRRLVDSEEGAQLRSWWLARLRDWPLALDLPWDGDPTQRAHRPGTSIFAVSSTAMGKLRRQFPAANLVRVLLAAWGTVLHRMTGQERFLLSMPSTLRREPYARTIGNFINLLVLRCDFRGLPSFAEMVERMSREVSEAGRKRAFPFTSLIRDLRAKAGTPVAPAIQGSFALSINGRDVEGATWKGDFAGLPCSPFPLSQFAGQDELSLAAALAEDGSLSCELRYDAHVFVPATVEAIGRLFCAVLDAVASSPDASVARLALAHDALSPGRVLDKVTTGQAGLDWLGARACAPDLPEILRLRGPLDETALRRSLDELVRRHDILRSRFAEADGRLIEVIAPRGRMPFTVIDVSAEDHASAHARRAALDGVKQPFDLARGPLMRATLCRRSATEHLLVLAMHPCTRNAWSMGVMAEELSAFYQGLATGTPNAVLAAEVRYPDQAQWLRDWLRGEGEERQLAYWKERLAGAPWAVELPTDRPRASVHTFRRASAAFCLNDATTSSLKEVGHRVGATPFMVLLAGFAALLSRYSGQGELVIGTPVPHRGEAEAQRLEGFFVNRLALRVSLESTTSFDALVRTVKDVVLGAFDNQDVPFAHVVEQLPEPPSHRPSPFQVMIQHGGASAPRWQLGPVEIAQLEPDAQIATSDLTLDLIDGGATIDGALVYDADLFDASTVERMARHFETLLDKVIDPATCSAPIASLDLVSPAERKVLLDDWNPTWKPVGALSLHGLFEAQAKRTPDAVAIAGVGGEGDVTYRELDRRARQLAYRLTQLSVGPGVLVGLCLPRSASLYVGMLAILKAGAGYVPLDPSHPIERIEWVLTDTAASVIVTSTTLAPLFDGKVDAQLVRVDDRGDDDESPLPESVTVPGDLAYVIHTSGTTGRPKGVAIPHVSAVAFVLAAVERYRIEPHDRVLQFATSSFDASVEEIFVTFAAGATLVPRPDEQDLAPHRMADWLRGMRVSVLDLPTAYWQLFAPSIASLPDVHLVLIGGEAANLQDVKAWLAAYPQRPRLLNHYGPTETTVAPMFHDLTASPPVGSVVPIGRPLGTARIYIVDLGGHLAPIGAPGELCIGGGCLARGYLGRPELTAEKFVPDPFTGGGGGGGARMYRSGDLARWRSDGAVEYLGRVDRQIKLRGFRIELGEIETILAEDERIAQAVAVLRKDHGNERIVAYIVTRDKLRPDLQELRARIGKKLPSYMVPSAFVVLDALPLTTSGKINRDALPAPEQDVGGHVAPRDPMEETLAEIWSEVLRVERVGVHDNFFELGGHSLLATKVVSRVRAQLAIEIPVRVMFEALTVAELASRLRAQRGSSPLAPPLVRQERSGPVIASYAQERLWFLDRLDPGSHVYNIHVAMRLRGPLYEKALRPSLDELVRRHEVLRTVFAEVEGRPVQIISGRTEMAIECSDVSNDAAPAESAMALARDHADRPFDLARGPLVRALLCRVSASDHVLVITMHHVCSDAWSIDVMLRELSAVYEAFSNGRASPLPELPVQYADYAVWQHQLLRGDVLDRQISYWKEHLAGAPAALELPTDRARPAMLSFRGATAPFSVGEATTKALKELARRIDATPFMVVLAGFAAILSRYSRQRDLVIGTPIANRGPAEVAGLIGFFLNTLALRVTFEPTTSFEELVRIVKSIALGGYANQDVPFERVVDVIGAPRDLSRTPVFQVMCVVQHADDDESARRLGPLQVERVMQGGGDVAKFDLTLFAWDAGNVLRGAFEYNTDLFDAATVQRMARHFETLLADLARHPMVPVDHAALISSEERRVLLDQWNATKRADDADLCLHELFEAQARATPDAVAVVDERTTLTYAQLATRAEDIAHWLAAHGVAPQTNVGVSVSRSVDMIAAVLGVLMAGAAYVPIDRKLPADRRRFMERDAFCVTVLTDESLAVAIAAERTAPRPPRVSVQPSWLSYVLYTSGSTGKPKGVMVEHRSVVNLVRSMLRFPGMTADDVMLGLTTLSFDVAGAEIYVPLAVGAKLVIATEEHGTDPMLLASLLERFGVTVAGATPASWQMLTLEGWRPPASMRIHTAGEALPRAVADRLLERGARLFNLYGPTETTIYSTATEVRANEPITIGRPIDNTQTYVLDARLQPQPIGVIGELYIAGAGVARGYLERRELTVERFLPDPFSDTPLARMYRTGDVARWRADGTLEYVGRIDHQVKLRGFRIELGEVESVLAQCPDVSANVVVVREDSPGDKRLVAYVVPRPGVPPLTAMALAAELRKKLPDYMVPSAFVVLDALPLTGSGKVDRNALPAPQFAAVEDHYVAPRDAIEQTLAEIWSEVLRVERVGVHDNFFELGGHSLLATMVVSRVRAKLAIEIPVRVMFEAPTVAELAAALRDGAPSGKNSPLVRLRGAGGGPRLVCVHALSGEAFAYVDLARVLDGWTVDALRGRDVAALPGNFPALAELYVDALLPTWSAETYLLGWSAGGLLAYEIARQLEQRGHPPAALILLDSFVLASEVDAPSDALAYVTLVAADLAIDLSAHADALRLARAAPEPERSRLAAKVIEEAIGIAPDEIEERVRVFSALSRASRAYTLGAAPGIPVHVISPKPARAIDTWNGLLRRATQVPVPGDHHSMLRAPNVSATAEAIRTLLRRG